MGHLRCRIWFCMGWEERELLIYVGWFKMNLWQMFLLIRAHTESDALKIMQYDSCHCKMWDSIVTNPKYILGYWIFPWSAKFGDLEQQKPSSGGFLCCESQKLHGPPEKYYNTQFLCAVFQKLQLTKVWIFANSRIWTADVKGVIFEINMTALSWQRNI